MQRLQPEQPALDEGDPARRVFMLSRMLAERRDRRLIRLETQSRVEMLDRAGLAEMAEGHSPA